MKLKGIAIVMILLASGVLIFCANDRNLSGRGLEPSGDFVGDDIYRVKAYGRAKGDGSQVNELQRHESACAAAKLAALGHVMSYGSGQDAASDSVTAEKNEAGSSFSGTIRNGTELKKTYDAETGICEVIIEFREPGIKKKILGR